MIKFLRWLLGFRASDNILQAETDKCKEEWSKVLRAFGKMNKKPTFTLKYLMAKRTFVSAQRKLDGFKSCDTIYDRSGNPVGWRLNSYFWKRPEVKRQLEASKRWR
ncbi:hypothetical protein vBVpaMR16F_153 [Vibrio phage vB_VpaM_R16F]|nr:hypothetical protein vBVpaMR16F_153 [Vibrio phage vB_VpaM_R16F]